MGAIFRTLARTGFRRGLGGAGGRGWLFLGLAAGLTQFLRRKRDEPKVAFTQTVEPGQTILIRHFGKDELPE